MCAFSDSRNSGLVVALRAIAHQPERLAGRITGAAMHSSPIRRSGSLDNIDTLLSVCYTTVVDPKPRYKVRRVVSRGTPSYQFGHYEMTGEPGARRSVFRVLVHLGEHATPEAANAAWREDVERSRSVGRDKTAARIEAKVRKLEGTINGEAR